MEQELPLYETKFWKVILRGDQAYLGRCVIVLKRESQEMSDLTPKEWSDFHANVIQKLEPAFKKAFDATMFNWTVIMSSAYKSETPNPQVHWHFRPRYSHDIDFAGEKFVDSEFAHHYDRKRTQLVSMDVLKKIFKEVNKYL